MGRKPSMFSKDYRKKLKLRRMKYMTILVVLVIAIGIFVFFFINNEGIASIGKNFLFKDKSEEKVENEKNGNSDLKTDGESESEVVNPQKEESTVTSFEVALDSGKKVTIEYEELNGKQKVKTVEGGLEVQCSVSPSQEQVLILDKTSQDMYVLKNKEELINITNPEYVSTNKEVFKKENVISNNPSYKWVESAQFIDDTHIAYSSGLPWINGNDDRYLWVFNIENNEHSGNFNVKGKKFVLSQITEKGLMISVDDKEMIIDKDGKIVQ